MLGTDLETQVKQLLEVLETVYRSALNKTSTKPKKRKKIFKRKKRGKQIQIIRRKTMAKLYET